MNEMLTFFKIIPLAFTFIPVNFSLVEAPLKLIFEYGVKLLSLISLKIIHKSLALEMNFQCRKQEKVAELEGLMSMVSDALEKSCV